MKFTKLLLNAFKTKRSVTFITCLTFFTIFMWTWKLPPYEVSPMTNLKEQNFDEKNIENNDIKILNKNENPKNNKLKDLYFFLQSKQSLFNQTYSVGNDSNSDSFNGVQFDINSTDVIVFLHIQKTGGTHLGHHLVRNLDTLKQCEHVKKLKYHKRYYCPRPNAKDETWLFSRYSTGKNMLIPAWCLVYIINFSSVSSIFSLLFYYIKQCVKHLRL